MTDPKYNYNLTYVDYRDMTGAFLWSDPIADEHRIFRPGETSTHGDLHYRIERVAVVDNTLHCNIVPVDIPVVYTDPHL